MGRMVILGDGGFARDLHRLIGAPMLDMDDPVPGDATVVIGIGDIQVRRALYEKYRGRVGSVLFPLTPYPGRLVGGMLLRGVVICSNVRFGENVLVNTGAQIDHDCKISSHSVIAPGAILCGGVLLGEQCFVGAGAIIVENVNLEPGTFVPAGTLCCGQTDMRRPQRLVSDRDFAVAMGASFEIDTRPGGINYFNAAGERIHPDAQPGGPPDGEGAS